jgi:8-oxo-dGTP diphosphatase
MIEFQVNYPEVGKTYIKRIGAYALIINEKNLLAIVKTNTGYFLPGGGVKENETFENCLQRECIKEIGFKIRILNDIACGNYYFYLTTLNTDMESIGYFYECDLLVWLDPKDAVKSLYLKNQQEAVKLLLLQHKKTSYNSE